MAYKQRQEQQHFSITSLKRSATPVSCWLQTVTKLAVTRPLSAVYVHVRLVSSTREAARSNRASTAVLHLLIASLVSQMAAGRRPTKLYAYYRFFVDVCLPDYDIPCSFYRSPNCMITFSPASKFQQPLFGTPNNFPSQNRPNQLSLSSNFVNCASHSLMAISQSYQTIIVNSL